MAVWAYPCRPCSGAGPEWFVAQSDVEQMPRDARIVRVHVDGEWVCALVDRSRREAVEGVIVRDVMAGDARTCPECARLLASAQAPAAVPAPAPAAAAARPQGRPLTVQAAAIAIRDARLVVVAASMGLVTSPGEAHMAISDLQAHFGDLPIVLMAQDDAGAPLYHGDPVLVQMLEGIPPEKMPWKEYTFA